MVEFGCVGAEIKWDTVCGFVVVVLWLWFCGCGFVVCGLHRKIRLTQLWVELSWVVAIRPFNLIQYKLTKLGKAQPQLVFTF